MRNLAMRMTVFFLLATFSLVGCVSNSYEHKPTGLTNQGEQIEFLNLKEAGKRYIVIDKSSAEIQAAVLSAYKSAFLERWGECESISLGLQFFSIERSYSSESFILSLLAESSSSKEEFFNKKDWYSERIGSAKTFLAEMLRCPEFFKVIEKKDIKGFELLLKEYGFNPCAPEITLQVLREFPNILYL